MTAVDFYFDCSSPWTYLGFHNFEPLIERFQFDVNYLPILVGGLFNTVNPSVYGSYGALCRNYHTYAAPPPRKIRPASCCGLAATPVAEC